MLVIQRAEGQSLILTLGGVEIEIKVLESRSTKAKIGIQAPADVFVERKETRESRKAAGNDQTCN